MGNSTKVAWLALAMGLASQLRADDEKSAAEAIAQAVPDTDIFLVQVDAGSKTLALDSIRNLTSRQGYDNQPAFLASGKVLLFSSIRDGLQSDVYRLDLTSGLQSRVTETPESEYSPTPVAAGGFSVVRVEIDGSQSLWLYSEEGQPVQRILPEVGNIGYHTWISGNRLALFLVEDPIRLVEMQLDSPQQRQWATSIGRSFPLDGNTGRLYAVQMDAESGPDLVSRDIASGQDWTVHAKVPEGAQDMAIGPDGDIWMAQGVRVLRLPRGAGQWRQVADFQQRLPGPIGRLAFSPDFSSLALVVTVPATEPDKQQ